MFAEVHFPQKLNPEDLDQYLEKGWFRMGQTIFTTNFLNFSKEFYSAIWLRVKLGQFTTDKKLQRLRKLNAGFRIEIKQAKLNPIQELLYANYRQTISFSASSSLHQLLYGDASDNVYNTHEVNIYDGAKLIATGFFDIGKKSAAGITSFYDPAYKKYSLGKYLIFLKMEYCKEMNLQYFYPGYFVPGYSAFDYKLKIGTPALEYLELSSKQWRPINTFTSAQNPLQVMYDKLYEVRAQLTQANIESKIFKYEFYSANLVRELHGAELFDFPILLYCSEIGEETVKPIIVYDVCDGKFHLLKCKSLWASDQTESLDETYSSHLLKIAQDLFSTERPEGIVTFILGQAKARIGSTPRIINFSIGSNDK